MIVFYFVVKRLEWTFFFTFYVPMIITFIQLFFTYFITKAYRIFQGAGAGTFLISFFLQFPFTMYCQRKDVSNFSKLLANFFVTVVGVIATVNTFRGYWYIMDVYLMPGKLNTSSSLYKIFKNFDLL